MLTRRLACIFTALSALMTLPAGLAGAGTVTGSVFYLERIALPPDATLDVTLADVSLADAPAQTLGTYTLTPAGQVPIPFHIDFDDSRIQPAHSYSVRAVVKVGSELLYTTTTNNPVLTRGSSTDAGRLKLERVARPSEHPDRALENTYWRLTALGTTPYVHKGPGREPSLVLHPDEHRASGSGGCNSYTGSYAVQGSTITFNKMAMTMMACIDGMDTESAFHAVLKATHGYAIHGDNLEFHDSTGQLLARFQAVDF